jgi:hypothetical protein
MILAAFRGWRTLRRLTAAIEELEERVERLESLTSESRLRILDTLEKVSQRLAWRERKRVSEDQGAANATPAIPPHLRHLDPISQRILMARQRAAAALSGKDGS